MVRDIFILIICLLFCSCSPRQSNNEKPLDFSTFKVIHKKISHFSEIGKITKAVKLETTDNSLIGTVYFVVLDESSGDFFVGDFGSSQKVFRFDNDGHFINSYGRRGKGPGEHTLINNFTVCENGDIVLLTDSKLIKFSRNGDLLLEKRINYYASDIYSLNDLFYVSVLRYNGQPEKKAAILVLNSFFEIIDTLGIYDTRLEKYSFSTYKSLYGAGNKLFFLDYYDLNLNLLDIPNHVLMKLAIPNTNSSLDSTWNKKTIVEKDRTEIRASIHRFNYIFAFDDYLFLTESCRKQGIMNAWILNQEKRDIFIFPYFGINRNPKIKTQNQLYFDYIVGAYKKGIIGIFDTEEEFNRFKVGYPALKNIQFATGDNPILALFEFDKNIFTAD